VTEWMEMATEKETDEEQPRRVEAKEGLKHTIGYVLIYKDLHLSNTIGLFPHRGKGSIGQVCEGHHTAGPAPWGLGLGGMGCPVPPHARLVRRNRRRTHHDYADYLGEITARLLAGV
jgi:hypothetical protein